MYFKQFTLVNEKLSQTTPQQPPMLWNACLARMIGFWIGDLSATSQVLLIALRVPWYQDTVEHFPEKSAVHGNRKTKQTNKRKLRLTLSLSHVVIIHRRLSSYKSQSPLPLIPGLRSEGTGYRWNTSVCYTSFSIKRARDITTFATPLPPPHLHLRPIQYQIHSLICIQFYVCLVLVHSLLYKNYSQLKKLIFIVQFQQSVNARETVLSFV